MKDLIVKNFTEFFTVYGMVLIFVLNIVLFHSQVLSLWEGYVRLTLSMFRTMILMTAFVFAALFVMTCNIGQNGKEGFSEYAYAHFLPVLAFMLIEFAEFLMTIFQNFLEKHHLLGGKSLCTLSLEGKRAKPLVRTFQSPALILLQ